ncbi:MAG: hypothetical protein AAFX86_14465, partial [Pseudomonadota bacterium]
MSGHKIEHPMTNLRKALNDDDLESFIAEHEDDAPGDMDKVDVIQGFAEVRHRVLDFVTTHP